MAEPSAAEPASDVRILPYGAWPSVVTADLVVAGARSFRELWLDGDDLLWVEGRPAEDGRYVVVRRGPDGAIEDVTPPGSDARNQVHEYGGGSYVASDGTVVYTERSDRRLYRIDPGRDPVPISAEGPYRYADLRIDRRHGRVVCIREDHTDGGASPVSTIAAVPLAGGETTVLFQGADFYSHPRLDASGSRLAWLAWALPDMPWDATELWIADVDAEGRLSRAQRIAGGPNESIAQPEWAPDGSLVYVSDASGWWNLYRWHATEGGGEAVALAPMEGEFADPQWVFGMSSYGIAPDGTIVAAARVAGRDRLFRIADGRPPEELEQPFAELSSIRVGPGGVVMLGTSPTEPSTIAALDLRDGSFRVVHRAAERPVPEDALSQPRPISFRSAGGRTAHAVFYPPTNPHARAPEGELPPLIVESHGGPTANASLGLSMETQFFTSRGFAVVDVDYGGSSGHGRAYRQLLDGAWGIVDVEDCIAAATSLASEGLVDPARMIIRGGSAGGFTTLRALTTSDVFAVGSSHFGVGDLEALARDTHKFESRYLDRLVGPYPEAIDVYRERSPIHAVDRIRCPVIVFQGLEDRVVPPAQAEELIAALERNGLPYAYLTFAGEGHGFRRAENIRRVLEAEMSFFAQLFGFQPADDIEPVPIANGPGSRLQTTG